MTDTPKNDSKVVPFKTRFSAKDREVLEDLFSVRRTGIRFYPSLHGFMTAIAIGPTPIAQETWLRAVWGHRLEPQPLDQRRIERLRDPVLRMYASVEHSLRPEVDTFRFDFTEEFGSRDATLSADMWCNGFFKATLLDEQSWRWLQKSQPELIRPIWLFGRGAGLKAMARTTRGYRATSAQWLPRIEPAVRAIRDFWRSGPDRSMKLRKRQTVR